MKDMNKIILIGRLGADPVQRETKTGVPVAQFPLATSRRVRPSGESESADGQETTEPSEETVWHRVVAWGTEAETCCKFLKKGDLVYVEGAIRTRKYESKDGTSRMAFEVHADSIGFLGMKRKKEVEQPQAVAVGE